MRFGKVPFNTVIVLHLFIFAGWGFLTVFLLYHSYLTLAITALLMAIFRFYRICRTVQKNNEKILLMLSTIENNGQLIQFPE